MGGGNPILFYVKHKTNQLSFSFDVRNFSFNNIVNEDTIHDLKLQIDECIKEMENTNKNMLLVCDWSNANLNDCQIFMPFLEKLIKKSQSLSPPGWRRKSNKTRRYLLPITMVNIFETTNIKDHFIQQVIRLHQKIYILQENLNTFLLPTISPSLDTIFPKCHILPQEILEKTVKDNLELITMLFLENGDKSGYHILKDIASHFHCILSQGTVYPLLYRLERENKILKKDGIGREVLYSLTQETKNQLQLRKENSLRAYQHLASFFENENET